MKDVTGKLIDKDINFDYSKMPKSVVEEIKELEKFNETGDWFMYDMKFDELEVNAKGYMLAGVITESDFYKIEMKYGRLYD